MLGRAARKSESRKANGEKRESMRFMPHVIALLCVILVVGCARGEGATGHETVARSGSAPTTERDPGTLNETPMPVVTSPKGATATVTIAAAQTPSRLPVVTPEATTAASPTPTLTAISTLTSTPVPTAFETPGTARPTTETIVNPDALTERGMKVYQEQYCGICHQLNVAGTAGMFGPTHNGVAQTAEQRIRDPRYTGKAATAGEYIRESILSPELYVVEGYEHTQHRMPAYANLSGTDLDALVQLLLQQK